MAKRILSADSALVARTQISLGDSVRTETRKDLFARLEDHWRETLSQGTPGLLYDWENQGALLRDMEFINTVQAKLDEAAVRIAPTLLKIVLTVKENLDTPKEQRAYLADHLDLDFRRISELCIVADSYGLLLGDYRKQGEAEINRYGWSKALKLAYVRDPADRAMIWDNACMGRPAASYRAILEEIKRFRERKMITPPTPRMEVETRMASVAAQYQELSQAAQMLDDEQGYRQTLRQVDAMRRELGRLKRALEDQLQAAETEALAASM